LSFNHEEAVAAVDGRYAGTADAARGAGSASAGRNRAWSIGRQYPLAIKRKLPTECSMSEVKAEPPSEEKQDWFRSEAYNPRETRPRKEIPNQFTAERQNGNPGSEDGK